MKVSEMIEILQELPPDYEMCFSEYTSVVYDIEDSTAEEYFVVVDMPIVGVIHNDDNEEVRFFTEMSSETVIREIENGREWKMLE